MKASQVWYEQGGGDEQYTPRKTVEILLPYIQHLKDKIIWCPFDKDDSQFVQVLRENGFKVVNSHIEYGQDFFKYEPKEWDVIISNPPYHNKRAYWERCLDFKKPFALLLPVNILSDSIINVTMKERERVMPTNPEPKNQILQRKNWADRQAANLQGCIFRGWHIQSAANPSRLRYLFRR